MAKKKMKTMRLDIAVHQKRLSTLDAQPQSLPAWAVAVMLCAAGLGLMLWLG